MTAIVIPAFNAAGTLTDLIRRVNGCVSDTEVVLVDDGSGDATAAVAEREGARVLRHVRNRGKGAALRTAFEFVLRRSEFESVVTLDADLQHIPEEVPKFLEARTRTGANLIIGARARRGTAMPFHRRLSNVVTSGLVSARTSCDIVDSQSGFRLLGREVLEAVQIESDGYEAETEMLIKAARKGLRIVFVPIETVYANEPSHMTHWATTKRFLKVLLQEF